MDPILDSIAKQRLALRLEILSLEGKISQLKDRLSRLDHSEAAYRGQSLTVFKAIGANNTAPEPAPTLSPKMTIQLMVLIVLEERPDGLIALDILKKINERFNKAYPRTSLSPQLSRLRQADQIHKKGKLWILGPAPLSDSEASGMP